MKYVGEIVVLFSCCFFFFLFSFKHGLGAVESRCGEVTFNFTLGCECETRAPPHRGTLLYRCVGWWFHGLWGKVRGGAWGAQQ